MKEIDVVAGILERDGKILLAQRSPYGDQPGLWEFPGGKVEVGESQPQALIRELREELAIDAVPATFVASHSWPVSGRMIHLHAWAVSVWQGEMQLLSHSALVWCTPEQAGNYPLAPADIPLLAAFMALRAATPADGC